jgi:hypothetical protein
MPYAQTLPDPVFHDLIAMLEILEDQRVQLTPTDSFSEWDHLQDQLETIQIKLEDLSHILQMIVGEEIKHRREVPQPAAPKPFAWIE